jgi:8-oxo-dGTP diphosphatase
MDPDINDDSRSDACRPEVDVRVVLFTVSDGRLRLALREQDDQFALPLGSPLPAESLDLAATRVLTWQMGVEERYLEQLYSLAESRWGRWTVSVTYLGLAHAENEGPPRTSGAWFDVAELPPMNAVDSRIVDYALLRLRAKLGYTTIAFHLLPPSFSLSELQQVYEAVLDRTIDKRNFRRRINAEGILEATGVTRREGSHRPARLYRFRAAHDAETYLTPAWAARNTRGSRDV